MTKADECIFIVGDHGGYLSTFQLITILWVLTFLIILHLIAWCITSGRFDEPTWKRPFTAILKFWTLHGKGRTYYILVWGYSISQITYLLILTVVTSPGTIHKYDDDTPIQLFEFYLFNLETSCLEAVEFFAMISMTDPPVSGTTRKHMGIKIAVGRSIVLAVFFFGLRWFFTIVVGINILVFSINRLGNNGVWAMSNMIITLFYLPRYLGMLVMWRKENIQMPRFTQKSQEEIVDTINLMPIIWEYIDAALAKTDKNQDIESLENQISDWIDNFYEDYIVMRLDISQNQVRSDYGVLTNIMIPRQNRAKILIVTTICLLIRILSTTGYAIIAFTGSWNALKFISFLNTATLGYPLFFFFSFTRLNYHIGDYTRF